MKERPILFSGAMVRAILDGRKTHTRRVANLHSDSFGDEYTTELKDGTLVDTVSLCPYGQPSDRLWVRETHYRWGRWVKDGFTKSGRQRWRFRAMKHGTAHSAVMFIDKIAETEIAKKRISKGWHKRPSIFMPRWASRITLEIVNVRVERLQEISEEDAQAEGIDAGWLVREKLSEARSAYKYLWDSLNAKSGLGWDVNPWVWVIEFKKL